MLCVRVGIRSYSSAGSVWRGGVLTDRLSTSDGSLTMRSSSRPENVSNDGRPRSWARRRGTLPALPARRAARPPCRSSRPRRACARAGRPARPL